jgi:hypothetical protein
MDKRYRALAGLHYPDGDAEYEKMLDGKPYRERIVAAGAEALNLPAKSVAAYLAMGRPVLEEIKAVKK